MTRKDYELLARALRDGQPGFLRIDEGAEPTDTRRGYVRAAVAIADALTAENVRFNRDKFMRAAGLIKGAVGFQEKRSTRQ